MITLELFYSKNLFTAKENQHLAEQFVDQAFSSFVWMPMEIQT